MNSYAVSGKMLYVVVRNKSDKTRIGDWRLRLESKERFRVSGNEIFGLFVFFVKI